MSGQNQAYTCHECEEVFQGRGRWQQHITKTGHQTRTPDTTDSGIKAMPAQDAAKSVEAGTPENNSSEGSSAPGDTLTCSVCSTVFLSEQLLRQHLLSFTSCNVCNVHLPPDWVLEAHYATTDRHPKCDRCGLGFRDDEDFGWHIFECWADLEGEPNPPTSAGVAVGSSSAYSPSGDVVDAPRDTPDKGKAPARRSSYSRQVEHTLHSATTANLEPAADLISPAAADTDSTPGLSLDGRSSTVPYVRAANSSEHETGRAIHPGAKPRTPTPTNQQVSALVNVTALGAQGYVRLSSELSN
ncbi:hypothetical protein C8T65DRAFT_216116 [Cerioporus squamosus]|nr:hypothetical protein C8T65DRAFT_216116 [Cerioporus squamosus]